MKNFINAIAVVVGLPLLFICIGHFSGCSTVPIHHEINNDLWHLQNAQTGKQINLYRAIIKDKIDLIANERIWFLERKEGKQ